MAQVSACGRLPKLLQAIRKAKDSTALLTSSEKMM
jgi:hypothetical protein